MPSAPFFSTVWNNSLDLPSKKLNPLFTNIVLMASMFMLNWLSQKRNMFSNTSADILAVLLLPLFALILMMVTMLLFITIDTRITNVKSKLFLLLILKKLIIHIRDKHFKMIRYYGLYAKHRNHSNVLCLFIPKEKRRFHPSLNKWRTSLFCHLFTIQLNAFMATKCLC